MSLGRATTSSTSAVFKAASTASSRPRPVRCPRCLCDYHSTIPRMPSSRRALQTVTAHRPSNLEQPPPPPRVDSPKSQHLADMSRSPAPPQLDQSPNIAAPTNETRRSPAASTLSSQASGVLLGSPPPNKSRRPTLRPRKAAMHLTSTAVAELRHLLDQPEPKFIRVGVKNRGCSGLAYHLEFVEKPGKFDESVEQDGVKVLIDSKALFSIIGSEMDWVEDKLNRRFIFKNPNISKWKSSRYLTHALTLYSRAMRMWRIFQRRMTSRKYCIYQQHFIVWRSIASLYRVHIS